jgi:hypothetical protein
MVKPTAVTGEPLGWNAYAFSEDPDGWIRQPSTPDE